MKVYVHRIFAIFCLLCITFIPLNFNGKGLQFQITSFVFHDLINFLEQIFFKNALTNVDFSSDSISLNLLIFVLFFVAFFFAMIIKNNQIVGVSRTIMVYYLVFILLKYGFDKVFKIQFYLPEPNILYSKFGDLSKDILYWSTMGTSQFYEVSLGVLEVFVAVLLLINRTRAIGLLLAIGIFINIILVNFGFDISVKTFSVFLLSATFFVAYPILKPIFEFFLLQKTVQLSIQKNNFNVSKPLYFSIKTFAVGMIFGTILLPYVEANNFNNDTSKRPFLHGVYEVVASNQKADAFRINRFYVHRKNYLIFEFKNGKQTDYHLEINQKEKFLKLTDYKSKIQIIPFKYSEKDSILQLQFPKFKISAKAQNWRKLNVLKNDFHWTIDEV